MSEVVIYSGQYSLKGKGLSGKARNGRNGMQNIQKLHNGLKKVGPLGFCTGARKTTLARVGVLCFHSLKSCDKSMSVAEFSEKPSTARARNRLGDGRSSNIALPCETLGPRVLTYQDVRTRDAAAIRRFKAPAVFTGKVSIVGELEAGLRDAATRIS